MKKSVYSPMNPTDFKLGSASQAQTLSAVLSGFCRISQLFNRIKRPTYTPMLESPATEKTNTQPSARENSRRIISCIKFRETIPNNIPVHENQISMMTSYQSGAAVGAWLKC